jgi:hypothetical protein
LCKGRSRIRQEGGGEQKEEGKKDTTSTQHASPVLWLRVQLIIGNTVLCLACMSQIKIEKLPCKIKLISGPSSRFTKGNEKPRDFRPKAGMEIRGLDGSAEFRRY